MRRPDHQARRADSRRRLHHRDLEGCAVVEVGQQTRETTGQHRLARPR